MRKIVFILTLAFALAAQAQDAQVANIRKLYAEVKENMDYRKAAEIPPNETVVTSNYMAPGAGPTKDVTHYFYDCDYDEEISTYIYTPYFITRKYNVGAIDYYEEFLFDKGSLVFYFCKTESTETRYYWGSNGFLHKTLKGDPNMDEVFASRLAGDLKAAFDRLMNREY
jgi:hypothetical protein